MSKEYKLDDLLSKVTEENKHKEINFESIKGKSSMKAGTQAFIVFTVIALIPIIWYIQEAIK